MKPEGLCDCRYESVESPGLLVAPVISRFPFAWLPQTGTPCMVPQGLYHCLVCGLYVYIRQEGKPLVLRLAPQAHLDLPQAG